MKTNDYIFYKKNRTPISNFTKPQLFKQTVPQPPRIIFDGKLDPLGAPVQSEVYIFPAEESSRPTITNQTKLRFASPARSKRNRQSVVETEGAPEEFRPTPQSAPGCRPRIGTFKAPKLAPLLRRQTQSERAANSAGGTED